MTINNKNVGKKIIKSDKEELVAGKAVVKQKKVVTPQLVRGMHDVLPADWLYWNYIIEQINAQALSYGYNRLETPVLEKTSLFTRAIGTTTDIVEKEMYSFTDQSTDHLTLRPEYTAGLARAYIEHGLLNWPQPVKLYALGPIFRHERPQAGRYRSFWQIDYEILGDPSAMADSQIILTAWSLCQSLKLPVTVQINSVGCPECRVDYRQALLDYYKTKKSDLCEDCKKRLQRNPLRLLDCKEPACKELAKNAPQLVDSLCQGCRQHFVTVLEYLDGVELTYQLNPYLVRGLDYYTRTVFEIWSQDDDGQTALAAGGRYDNLIADLGGQPTPAVGFAAGVERLVNEMKKRQVPLLPAPTPDVFLACLGGEAKKMALKLFEDLKNQGVRVGENFAKDGLKSQLESANRLGVKYTLVLGQKEMMDGTVIVRDMENGIQETVDFKKIVNEVKKRLVAYRAEVLLIKDQADKLAEPEVNPDNK
ncbi:MAG: histidine--tRNA ligase [Patescibacteria group bacterium]